MPLLREAFAVIDRNQVYGMLYSLGHPERYYAVPRSLEIMNFLLKYLKHPDFHASCAAASALGSLRYEEALPALKIRENDADPRVVWDIKRAMKKIESRVLIENWLEKYSTMRVKTTLDEMKTAWGEPENIRQYQAVEFERVVRLAENEIDHSSIKRVAKVVSYEPVVGVKFEFYFSDDDALIAKHYST